MAQPTQYLVIHPVRHNLKAYNRGDLIPADKFKPATAKKEGEAEQLIRLGHLAIPGETSVIVAGPELTLKHIEPWTVSQLVEYGVSRYGLTFAAGATKAEILGQISEAIQAGVALNEANELAREQGE